MSKLRIAGVIPARLSSTRLARKVLRAYRESEDLWPTQWIPRRLDAAKEKLGQLLEAEVGNL